MAGFTFVDFNFPMLTPSSKIGKARRLRLNGCGDWVFVNRKDCFFIGIFCKKRVGRGSTMSNGDV